MGIFDWLFGKKKEKDIHPSADILKKMMHASKDKKTNDYDEKLVDKNKAHNISQLRVHEDELEDVGVVTHYNGKPFTGIMYKLWDNGNLEEEYEMVDGLKHGINRNYHENGKIMEEINYKNDEEHPIKDGVERLWNENGQLSYEIPYSNEKRNGLKKVWNENGTLTELIEYKDNEIISEIYYDQNGNELPNGKKHGPVKFYHPNGNLEVEGNWNNEKQDGLWSWFWENGKLEKQIEFKDGEMLSEKFYNEDGIAIDKQQYQQILDNHDDYEDEDCEDDKITTNENADFIKEISKNWRKFLLNVTEIECDEKEELTDTKFDIFFCDSNFCDENEDVIFRAKEMQIKIWYKEDGEWHEGDTTYYPELICGDDKDNDYETYIFFNTPNANPELGNGWSNTGEMELNETVTFLENMKTLDYKLLSDEEKNDFGYFSLTKTNSKLTNNNNETLKSSESVDLSGDQKMLHVVYPKLKGIDFSTVKFGASGNSAKEFFASDIDGDWHYAQSQMIMLFKAFSKDKIESELKLLLNQNEINFDEKIEKTELLAEHWKGDGFKIEHPVMEGIDIIIITNEDMVPEDSLTLQKTDLASEVKLPTGYENIGIDHVYDGSKFLKANQGQLSLNIPLLFKDNDDSPHYILIGVTTLTLAKRIIDEIIEKNYGKQYFKELDEKDDWQYIYANKFFTIGFLSKYHCVRINMLHNLVDISEN